MLHPARGPAPIPLLDSGPDPDAAQPAQHAVE
jgi:hypothetical protein